MYFRQFNAALLVSLAVVASVCLPGVHSFRFVTSTNSSGIQFITHTEFKDLAMMFPNLYAIVSSLPVKLDLNSNNEQRWNRLETTQPTTLPTEPPTTVPTQPPTTQPTTVQTEPPTTVQTEPPTTVPTEPPTTVPTEPPTTVPTEPPTTQPTEPPTTELTTVQTTVPVVQTEAPTTVPIESTTLRMVQTEPTTTVPVESTTVPVVQTEPPTPVPVESSTTRVVQTEPTTVPVVQTTPTTVQVESTTVPVVLSNARSEIPEIVPELPAISPRKSSVARLIMKNKTHELKPVKKPSIVWFINSTHSDTLNISNNATEKHQLLDSLLNTTKFLDLNASSLGYNPIVRIENVPKSSDFWFLFNPVNATFDKLQSDRKDKYDMFAYNPAWIIGLSVIGTVIAVFFLGCVVAICYTRRPYRRPGKVYEVESANRKNNANHQIPQIPTINPATRTATLMKNKDSFY